MSLIANPNKDSIHRALRSGHQESKLGNNSEKPIPALIIFN